MQIRTHRERETPANISHAEIIYLETDIVSIRLLFKKEQKIKHV